MDGFSPSGVGDTAGGRPLILRDSSKNEEGQASELGSGSSSLVSIITGAKKDGTVTGIRDGILQPRNWHESISDKPAAEGRSLKDRRYSVALIADHQNGFDGFAADASGGSGTQDGGPGAASGSTAGKSGDPTGTGLSGSASGSGLFSGSEASLLDSGGHLDSKGNFISPGNSQAATDISGAALGFGGSFVVGGGKDAGVPGDVSGRSNNVPPKSLNPIVDDWGPAQKSTRIIDYKGKKGRAALLAQIARVIDDANQQYTAAIPFRRLSPSDKSDTDRIATGYLYDAKKKQSGFLDSVFVVNSKDKTGAGREGTAYGILGIRTDSHYEWVPAASGTTGTGKGEAPDIDESKHGPMKFDPNTDISSGYTKGFLGLDKSVTPNVWVPTFNSGGSGGSPGDYGDFSDGNVSLDGTTSTFLTGITQTLHIDTHNNATTAGIYYDSNGSGRPTVYKLARNIWCDTLDIPTGIILLPNGYRIYARKITGAGKISMNPIDFMDDGSGVFWVASVFNVAGFANMLVAGAPTLNANGSPGQACLGAPAALNGSTSTLGAGTGWGGAGGNCGAKTGGATQKSTVVNTANYDRSSAYENLNGGQGICRSQSASSGSAGGSDATHLGGYGGTCGGAIQINCSDMSGFTGTIDASGSPGEPGDGSLRGATASAYGAFASGGGGGGGGGGGAVVIVTGKDGTYTVLSNAGAGGVAGSAGTAGAAGTPGYISRRLTS